MKLLIVSKPVRGNVEDILKIVGVDKKTIVVVLGCGDDCIDCCCGSGCMCFNLLNSFCEIAEEVFRVVEDRSVSRVKFVLGDSDAFSSLAVYLLYTVFSSIELFSRVEVDFLNFVYRGELFEVDFKPRFYIDFRNLRILSALKDKCRTSLELANDLNISGSSVRRRLLNMFKNGFLDISYKNKTRIYCLTTLGKIFAYSLTQTLL